MHYKGFLRDFLLEVSAHNTVSYIADFVKEFLRKKNCFVIVLLLQPLLNR